MSTMAATGSDSFSSGPTLSDTDLETISSEELVTFHSTQQAFSSKKDIVAIYSTGNAVDTSPRDWIGLFKSGWQTTYDFSAYQWVPFDPLHACQPRKRRAIFPQADIQDLSGRFQFLYVTGDVEVIGVSESFEVCDLESATESTSFVHENIPPSLSLISLGSQSSSSDDINCWEGLSEKKTDVVEDDVSQSRPSKSELSALLPQKDNWTLSDFVIGNRVGGLFQKLCFAQTYDWKSLLEEFEPPKRIYLTPSRKERCFIEEIQSESPELTASSSHQATVSSDVMVADPSAICVSSQRPSAPLVFTFYREALPSRQSCLQMYHPKLLMSTVEETNSVVPAAISKDKKTQKKWPWCAKWTFEQPTAPQSLSTTWFTEPPVFAPFTLPEKSSKRCDCEFINRAPQYKEERSKRCDYEFRSRAWEHKDHSPFSISQGETKAVEEKCITLSLKKVPQAGSLPARGAIGLKRVTSTSARITKKRRYTQRSKIKKHRSQQQTLVQGALTLLTKSSWSAPSIASNTVTGQQSLGTEELFVSAQGEHSPSTHRKRRSPTVQSISQAKRRRLARKTPIPVLPTSQSLEDEGYFSAEEEEDSKEISSTENLELLSLALTEALRNIAELRAQVSRATNHQYIGTDDLDVSRRSKRQKTSQCDQPVVAGKAMNTDRQMMCDAAANTIQAVRKDSRVQCSNTGRGKATNTDRKSKRHVASNTPVTVKTDAPCQCATNTTSTKSVNTLSTSSSRDAESVKPVAHDDKSVVQYGRRSVAQPETLDLTVHRATSPAAPVDSLDDSFSGWRKVASKRMIRLQKLIAKKKQEFTRLRENAENYEKRTHTLEASLQVVRSALSAETMKRMNAEKELRDLRIKFWELLAFRKSQPWRNVNKTPNIVPFHEKPEEPKPRSRCELHSAKTLNTVSVQGTTEAQTMHKQAETLPDLKEDCPETLIQSTPSKKDTLCKSADDLKPNEIAENKEDEIGTQYSSSVDKLRTTEELKRKQPENKEDDVCVSPLPEITKSTEAVKLRKTRNKEEEGTKHATTAATKPQPAQEIPVVATARINGVPVRVTEVKKATCGSISFKKFLMPAVTALAETFSSSKSKSKTSSREDLASHSTTRSSSLGGKSSSATFAKVTVSISAGIPSTKTSSKDHKSGTRNKSSKRSNSRNTEKTATESGKTPYQETFPDSSSDITLRRRSSATRSKSQKLEYKEVLPFPIILPLPKDDNSQPGDDSIPTNHLPPAKCTKGDEPSTNEETKWRPLNIRDERCTKDDDVFRDVTAPSVSPVKFCLAKYKSAGKGRAVTYANVETDGQKAAERMNLAPSSLLLPPPLSCLLHPPLPAPNTPTPLPLPEPNSPPLSDLTASSAITTQPKILPMMTLHLPKQGENQQVLHHHHHHHRYQQQLPTPPRTLQYDFVKEYSDVIGRQIRQGKCVTCGMKFSPFVDRYLVEEHIYFHHAFTE